MPKTDATFDLTQYTPVADRISLFFEVFLAVELSHDSSGVVRRK
jgi:hypothetical protein